MCSSLFNFCVPGEAFHPRAVVARHLTITPKLLFLASPGAIPTAELVYLAGLLAVAGWTLLLPLGLALGFVVVESELGIYDGEGENGNFDQWESPPLWQHGARAHALPSRQREGVLAIFFASFSAVPERA